MSDRLTAALEYARRGRHVLPLHHVAEGRCSCTSPDCRQAGKHPRTRNGLNDASTDPATIQEWWGKWPDANVAVATGPASGVWVLAPDGPEGLADLERLVEEYGPLPPTARNKSGSGGQHLVFAWPADGKPVTNRQNHRGTKIDVRGGGGYAVAPPSVNAVGQYQWLDDIEPAEAPPWLIEWVRGKEVTGAVVPPTPALIERAKRYLDGCPPAVAGQGGHGQTFRVARALCWGFGLPAEVGLDLLRSHYNPRCEPPWSEAELAHKANDAATKGYGRPRGYLLGTDRDDPPAGTSPPTADDAPRIVIGTDEFRVNAEAVASLARDPDLYQRGGMLVHVVEAKTEDDATAAVRRPDPTPVVRDLPHALLRERMTRTADYHKWIGTGDNAKLAPAHPPEWSVAAVAARQDWPGVRRLEAVVPHPVLLPDGSILAASGFHPPSGLLVCLPRDLCLTVPDRPTRDDVAAAVALLEDVVSDFPFETPAHRAAWFAGLLTPLAWFAFPGPAPLFLMDANVRAAGKGLLADVIALIITGRRFPAMSYTADREEMRKRITTLAIEGDRIVVLDNLAGAVGNDVLDAALTADQWKDRRLGGNRGFHGPLHVCWFATGNNVQLHADTARRVCHIRMETADERPEMKTGFKYDLRPHVAANRGPLLSAALTILRGWVVAGRPKHGLTPWGSYEGWSSVVREAVVFAGLPDPGETRLAFQSAADIDANAMAALLDALDRMGAGPRGVTAVEIIDAVRNPADPPPAWLPDLRTAVEDLCGRVDSRSLGYKFRHYARRNFGGRMIDRGGADRMHGNRWVVRSVPRPPDRPTPSPASPASPAAEQPFTGDAGDAGDAPRPKGMAADRFADQLPPRY